ncbi:MAG: DUF2304 family protein [Candidatus Gracilibacteria bacterium]
MNLLQFFFIISGIVILIISVDIANKQKFNALHFLVFIGVGGGLLIFTFFPSILNAIGDLFGIARGADVLVYTSIIFLLYFVLLLLTKHVENRESITALIREGAICNSSKKIIQGKEVFLIRVFNEATVLKGILREIIDKGHDNILVVNDGSIDNSRKILENFGDKIVLINHSMNRGAGAALKTGFEYLRRFGEVEYIVTFDADGQHDINDIGKFYKQFEKHPKIGVVFGSRFKGRTHSNVPVIRKITLFFGKIFTLLVSHVYLTDAHNGYRVFKLKTIKKINLSIDGMAYASELIEELRKHKIKIKEVPVNIKYTQYSMHKGQSSGNAISIALRILWSKFFR